MRDDDGPGPLTHVSAPEPMRCRRLNEALHGKRVAARR